MHSTTAESVPFPPDPNRRKPRLDVPPGSWDTHFHIYGPPHRFPYAETRRFTPPAAPIEHWRSVSAARGIERGVLVMPAVHGGDTAVIVSTSPRTPQRVRKYWSKRRRAFSITERHRSRYVPNRISLYLNKYSLSFAVYAAVFEERPAKRNESPPARSIHG